MTAVQAGALGDDADKWSSIDFEHARREVRRLQVRIAKAVQENRWNKVSALQYLLTHSFHAKLLAVKRVTSNKGKKTPGIDGVLWRGARAKWRAVISLRRRGYHPQPLRRIYIEKKNGKLRPLSIPIMYDRAQQALFLTITDGKVHDVKAAPLIPIEPEGIYVVDRAYIDFDWLRSIDDICAFFVTPLEKIYQMDPCCIPSGR